MLFPSLEAFWCCLKHYFSQTHRIKRTNLWLPKEKGGEEGQTVREFGTDVYTQSHVKWITSKDLLYSTRNPAQYYVTT